VSWALRKNEKQQGAAAASRGMDREGKKSKSMEVDPDSDPAPVPAAEMERETLVHQNFFDGASRNAARVTIHRRLRPRRLRLRRPQLTFSPRLGRRRSFLRSSW